MAKRGYLTEREKLVMLRAQNWRCVCRENCGQPLWPGAPVRWDHRPPLALTGVAKPNQAVTPHCHDTLTKQDVKDISRAVRLEKKAKGEWRPNRKRIRSRGFDKTLRKKMNGEVVRVDG